MSETWLPIPGYEGRYDVSDQGRVRSWVTRRISIVPHVLMPGLQATDRYLAVRLYSATGVGHRFRIHNLVALAFIGSRPLGQQVRHLDGNPVHNTRTNLTYGTRAENVQDAIRHGTHARMPAKRRRSVA